MVGGDHDQLFMYMSFSALQQLCELSTVLHVSSPRVPVCGVHGHFHLHVSSMLLYSVCPWKSLECQHYSSVSL